MSESKRCDAPDCENAPRTPGGRFCEKHYYRMRKFGSLELPTREFAKDKPCKVDGCEQSGGRAQGYCGKHWERVKRHGDPNAFLVDHENPERRFWAKVDKSGDCWLWTGSLTYDGYGIFGVAGDRTGAHRWAWRFAGREIPAGMHLDHLCRVRNCVRVDHLEVVTPAENTRRAAAAKPLICPRNHPVRLLPSGGRYCPTCRSERYYAKKEVAA